MANAGYISPSKLSALFSCPNKYNLIYVDKPEVKPPSSVFLVFGKEIHHMLDQFYKKKFRSEDTFVGSWYYRWRKSIAGEFLKGKEKERIDPKVIRYRARNREIGAGYIDKELVIGNHVRFFGDDEEYLKRIFFSYGRVGESMLRKFWKRHKEKPMPLATEKRIYNKDFRGFKVMGVIDRIDAHNGSVWISDYKTGVGGPKEIRDENRGKVIPGKSSIDAVRQFRIYSMLYRSNPSLFGEGLPPGEKSVFYYHMRTGMLFPFVIGPEDIDGIEKDCQELTKIVEKERFEKNYDEQGCYFCDQQEACLGNKISFQVRPEDLTEDQALFVIELFSGGWEAEMLD